jgi:hypothetical protein
MKKPSALRLLNSAVNTDLLPVIEEIGFRREPDYEKLQVEYHGAVYAISFFRFLPPRELASLFISVSRERDPYLGINMNLLAFAEPCENAEEAYARAHAAHEKSGLRLLAPASHDSSVYFTDRYLIGLPKPWRLSGDGPPEVLQARAEALARRAARRLISRMPDALARARRRPVATIAGRGEAVAYQIHRYPSPLPVRWLVAITSLGLPKGEGPPPPG